MAGTFEIFEDKAGQYRFRLKAANGQVISTGEPYLTRAGARSGCEAVQQAAPGAVIEEV
jgi:uncharacterized protein YegP (UPF0339 family)